MRTLSALGLVCTLALACSDEGSAPGQVDGPAGEVLEAEGKVTAIRSADGSSPRELSAGDTIYGDDTVETGPAASVRIRLDHNGAIWSLGEEARREVRASVAWKAPKASSEEGLLGRQEEGRTSAAGRHAEREAGDTRATALKQDQAEAEPAPPEPEPSRADEDRAEGAPPPAPPRRPRRRRARESASSSDSAAEGVEREEPGIVGSASDDALGRGGGKGGGGGREGAKDKTKLRLETSRGVPPKDSAVLARVLRRCFARHGEAPGGAVKISLTIGKDGEVEGRPRLSTSVEGLDKVLACARAALKKETFSGAGRLETRVELKR